MANNRELSQFGSLVEVSNEATSIKVGLADANVGLGTTNPTERLEVHGNIKVVGGSINVGSAGTFTEQTTFSAGVGIADSIFHIGDTNTQVRFPAEDIVSVETGGSERLRVESGGGIGIGDSIYHLGDTNTQVRFPAADTFTVETAGSERLRVGSNGYVSVGKGAQGDELLHVGSASSLSPAIKVENDQGSLIIGRRQTSRFGIGTEGHVIQSAGDDFAIGTSDNEDFTIGTNNEKRITVKSNGRVGIGTDDPDELLEVLGKAKVIDLDASNISVASGVGTFQTLKVTGDLTVEGTTTTLDTNLIGVDRVEVGANSDSIVGVAVTQSGKADILKLFNGAGTEVLGITTDGNITIQNTDPGSSAAPELSLYRNSASPANADYLGQIKFQGENNAGAKVNYAKITGKILDVNGSGDSEDGILEFAFQKAGSNNISARFRSDSLQLINGTTLTVAGNITANGNIQGDGDTNITSINDITAGGVLTVDGVSDLDELTVAGVSTFSGQVGFTTHVDINDHSRLRFGDDDDLQIYHDGTDSYIQDSRNNGKLRLSADIFQVIDKDATETMLKATVDGAVELNYNGSKKFETTGLGVTVSGNLGVRTDLSVYGALDVDGVANLDEVVVAGVSTFSGNIFVGAAATVGFGTHVSFRDTAKATFGASSDLQIYHDGTDSYIDNNTQHLYIRSNVDGDDGGNIYIQAKSGEDSIVCNDDGNVQLYYNNVNTFQTNANGIKVQGPSGGSAILYLNADQGSDDIDKFRFKVEDGGPLSIENDASGSWETSIQINGNGSVNLYHDNSKKFETTGLGATVSGSLGIRTDLTVYGTSTFQSHVHLGNDDELRLGDADGGDMVIVHDGDHGVIDNNDGNLNIKSEGNISLNPNNTNDGLNVINQGAVELFHNNVKKFETTGLGATVSGSLGIRTDLTVYGTLDVDGVANLDEVVVAGVSTLSGGLNVNTVAGATNDSNVAFGARASNGAHVISLTLKPNRLAHFDGGVGIADSIFHIGDDNAQLRFPAADTFTVETAGDERLRVTSGGLVGINTTNPFGQLQVRAGTDANFSFTTGSGESSLELINDAGSANVPVNIRASEYKIKIGGTEKLRITSGGLVGIGITNPEKLFEVSSSSSPTIRINNSDGSITADQTIGAIEFKANDGSNAADQVTGSIESIAQAAFTGQGSPSHLIFKTNGVSGVDALKERLRITHDGNVGIGTDNPGSLLTLNHATNPAIQFKDSNTKVASINAEGTQTNIASFESKDMVFAASTSSAFEERVRITSAGKVGINTTGPNATLTVGPVNSPSFNRGAVAIKAVQDGNSLPANIYLEELSGAEGYTLSIDSNGDLNFHNSGASSPTVTFADDNKVGIGTEADTPLVTLHVGGTDAIRVPSGTSAQRPTGAVGYIRYNSDIGSYEGHNGSEWAGIGGAAEVETSVSSTAATTCESFAKASYRSATIVAQITQGSSYQVGNYLLIHDGTTATLVEESAVATGDMLGSFTGAVSGSNVVFQVNMASSAAATVTTKMTKVSIP